MRVSDWAIGGILAVLVAVAILVPLLGRRHPGAVPVERPAPARAGALLVMTTPAGATVHLNGQLRGKTAVDPRARGRSEPLRCAGLPPGSHEVRVQLDGISASRTVQLLPGQEQFLHLVVWRPASVVHMTSGQTLVGMVLAQAAGELEIAVSATEIRRVPLDGVREIRDTIAAVAGPPLSPKVNAVTGETEIIIEPFPESP